ncbi:MAG TPA: hypothetical protein DDZ41_05765, partial [Flavobacterium sp.]|nr:hypothetical protein [Flavobacterium sp.]
NESKLTALKRLNCLERKLDKNASYAQSYCSKMNEYISKGYIKKLSDSELQCSNSKLWYLPHFGVSNPNKLNKLRIVFDAAAKSKGYSLNDYLLTGPDFYNMLPEILMNFRINRIAFIGDIKEMFLQILVRNEDKPAQRFLWRNMRRDIEPETYEIQVVFFGATCSPSIAQAVLTKNATEHSDSYPKACYEIKNNHYMDDYLGGADSLDEAIKLVNDIITVHKCGGFEICNW